jgi:hypothetical protein
VSIPRYDARRRPVTGSEAFAGELDALAGVVAAVAAIWLLIARPYPDLCRRRWRCRGGFWTVRRKVARVLGRGDGLVGITTGVYGAGGFGKTALAQVVCADSRARRGFRDGTRLFCRSDILLSAVDPA